MATVSDKIQELEATRARLAKIEAAIQQELADLPARYGFAVTKSFIAAVLAASGSKQGGRGAAKRVAKKGRKRARITDETRAEVKKLVQAGKTGNEIAKAVGISLPSVQNIKKDLGLVQPHKKK